MSTEKMDPAVKARWVEALRSGKYTQTTGTLRSRDGHCCIGVLAEVAGWDWSLGDIVNGENYFDGADDDGASLCAMTGLPKDEIPTLARMNDGRRDLALRRHSFAEIADYIEANL